MALHVLVPMYVCAQDHHITMDLYVTIHLHVEGQKERWALEPLTFSLVQVRQTAVFSVSSKNNELNMMN